VGMFQIRDFDCGAGNHNFVTGRARFNGSQRKRFRQPLALDVQQLAPANLGLLCIRFVTISWRFSSFPTLAQSKKSFLSKRNFSRAVQRQRPRRFFETFFCAKRHTSELVADVSRIMCRFCQNPIETNAKTIQVLLSAAINSQVGVYIRELKRTQAKTRRVASTYLYELSRSRILELRSPARNAIIWMVLPRPISSPRMPPACWVCSSQSHFTPVFWYLCRQR